MSKKVVIYGAGNNALRAIDIINREYVEEGYKIVSFCDIDRGKWGKR